MYWGVTNMNNENIVIIVEQCESTINPSAYAVIEYGIRLVNKLNSKLIAIVIGYNIECIIGHLNIEGIDHIVILDDRRLENYDEETYMDIYEQIISSLSPSIVLLASTFAGKSLAARLGTRFDTGVTSDCIYLEIDNNGLLVQRRTAKNGMTLADIICPECRPQIATLYNKSQSAHFKRRNEIPSIIIPNIKWSSVKKSKIKILKRINEVKTTSDVVFGIGRGVGSYENLQRIIELAKKINAGIGVTKAIVDLGWMDYSYQIGQTGKGISASVYIACGISGSIQHIVGITSVKKIIAINTDRFAPIFSYADYGIVATMNEGLEKICSYLISESGTEDGKSSN